MSSLCAFGQTTSTITGTIRDLTNALVTSGKVTFTLSPSRDTTISGAARFSPQTVTCGINGSGQILNQGLSGACTVTMNTALMPTGTYYVVNIYPFNVKTSSFTFYAVLSTYDWSTVVPTPTTSPAQNFVDVYSTQTIGGNKTFSGNTTFSGNQTFTGNLTLPGSTTMAGGTLNGAYGGNPTFFNNPVFSGAPVFNNPLQLTLTNTLFSNGINNNGTGLKHARFGATCATANTVGASCNSTYTWTSPFGDGNYTVSCTLLGGVTGVPTISNIFTVIGSQFSLTIAALTASPASAPGVDCIAIHD